MHPRGAPYRAPAWAPESCPLRTSRRYARGASGSDRGCPRLSDRWPPPLRVSWCGSFSARPIPQRFQQHGSSAVRSRFQPPAPIREQVKQMLAQVRHIGQLTFQLFQFASRQSSYFPAGCAASLSHPKHARKLSQRQAQPQRSPNQPYAVYRLRRVLPVSRARPHRTRQDAHPLIGDAGCRC
jgi:hypothetical protein